LRNEELHNLFCLLNITMALKSRRMWCTGHVARMKDEYKILVVNPRRRWEDNIKIGE
jgi:hypothetical protein